MLSGMRIAGFKRFDGDGVEIPLRPITLLFGGNSAGKSSLLQAILSVAQSWERPTGEPVS